MSDTYFWKKTVNFKTETAENAAVRALLIGGTALGRGEGAWPRSSGSAHCRVPSQHGETLPIGSRSQSLCLSGNEQAGSATLRPLETTLKIFLCWLSGICPQDCCETDSTASVLSVDGAAPAQNRARESHSTSGCHLQ